jgi:hypothetical protein
MQTTAPTTNRPDAPRLATLPHLTLDDLARKTFDELAALYRGATAPASMHAADGALRGRMLAVKGVERSPIAGWLRRFAGSRSFVWGGKTFAARDDHHGDGHNRVALGSVLGRQNLFPFTTRFDRSAIDSGRTIVLDYDLDVNPPYIRRIHDEIRELQPGLFLGPAMWKTAKAPVTVLWFALDARKPS